MAIVTTANSGKVDDAMAEWMPTLLARFVPMISATEQYAHSDSDFYDRKVWVLREPHKERREERMVVVGDGAYENWVAETIDHADDARVALIKGPFAHSMRASLNASITPRPSKSWRR